MVDLYITSKDFEDNLIRETKIGELIKNNKVRILLADKDSEAVNQIVASEKCLSHNCYIKLYYQGGKASNPMPGLEMMNAFKKDLYKAIGVKEYILVSQDWKVELYRLNTDNSNCCEDIIGIFESTYLDIKINFESIYSKVYKKLNLGVE